MLLLYYYLTLIIKFILSLSHIYIYIKGVTPAGSTRRYNIAGGSEEEERQENRKVGVKRKWRVLALPPIPRKETPGSYPGWNHRTKGVDHLTWRRAQGADVGKGWDAPAVSLVLPAFGDTGSLE